MSRKKAFFISFFISMVAVLTIYRLAWGSMQSRSKETDTPQTGIPKAAPGVYDSRTVFLGLGDRDNPYFFILKLSAISNRISIGCISPSYVFSDGKTLADSFASAGIVQCKMDVEEEFNINMDYYLWCSWTQAAMLVEDMDDIGLDSLGQQLPPIIKDYLLEGAEKTNGQTLVRCAEKAAGFLDNETGLAFLTESMAQLIINKPKSLGYCAQAVRENYSALTTNLNTTSLAGMERITDFLAVSHVEYPRQVIVEGDGRATEKIAIILE